MKYNSNNLYDKVKKALDKMEVSEETKELVISGIKLMQESKYPLFECLELESAFISDNKIGSLKLTFSSYTRYSNEVNTFVMNVLGDEMTIVDTGLLFKLIDNMSSRTIIFKYGKDIIRINGYKEELEAHPDALDNYIKEYGGYRKIDISVYFDAWYKMERVNLEKLDIDKLEPEYVVCFPAETSSDSYSTEAYIRNIYDHNNKIDLKKFEKSLDTMMRLGILLRNYGLAHEIDVYDSSVGRSR